MDKKVLLSELLLKALDYLQNPLDKEKEKEFEDLKNLITVKVFLPLIDKEAILLRIAYNQDQAFGDSAMGYTCVTELALIIHGLLAYTNIDINIGIDYKQYGVYDTIMESGLYDYILSYCKTGGAYYGGDINIKTLSQGAYGSANVNIWAQQGGYSGTDTGKIYIVAKKDSGDSRTGNSIHIYSEMYGADAGTLFLQEQAGEIVCGDTSDHSGTKFYLKGDVGGIVASPKVCEFVGQNARDAYGGGSSGGDSLFEATDGGDSTGGNGNGGDGGDILFRAGLHGNKSGTGTNGADGNCKFGVETTTNYLEIKGDGELALYGTARVKRFVQINATATKGVGTNPATEGEIGLNGCMIFSKTIDENIGSVITIPNDMDRSVAPTIRIGWASPVTTGNIKWEVKSLYRSENEDISSTTADDTIDVVDAVSSTSNGYQYTSFTLSAPSSTDRVVQIRITRLGSDASDTADDVANLLGFLFEYTSNKLGTAT